MKNKNQDAAGAATALAILLGLGFLEALADLLVRVWPW